MSAEYGRNSGAVVNIATRSGTNELPRRGVRVLPRRLDGREELLRDDRRTRSSRNQFGGSVGGPIQRDKMFFFGAYEGLRQRRASRFNSGVLTEAQRAGVTDPESRNLLQFIPLPNATGASGEGRFVGSATAPVEHRPV